jgi:hypothetical protein
MLIEAFAIWPNEGQDILAIAGSNLTGVDRGGQRAQAGGFAVILASPRMAQSLFALASKWVANNQDHACKARFDSRNLANLYGFVGAC